MLDWGKSSIVNMAPKRMIESFKNREKWRNPFEC